MIAVLTGDIINSRKVNTRAWLPVLKKELASIGDTPRQWEIYRGDSFQVEVKDPTDALRIALLLKAAMRTLPGVDVRIAIGIGDKRFSGAKITESNGSAFVNSGEKYDQLKKEKQELAVKTPWPDFDDEYNLYLKLVLVAMKYWTQNTAVSVRMAMKNPGKSQELLGKSMKIKQNTVSTRLKRARYYEITEVLDRFKAKLEERL